MKLISAFFLICLFLSCNQTTNTDAAKPSIDASAGTAIENQSATDSSLTRVVQKYIQLKDAFVEADTSLINASAQRFLTEIDQVFPETDTGVSSSVRMISGNIEAETKGLLGEADLTEKRKEFSIVSDNLLDLLKSVHYKGEKLYQQTCPMAFNDTEKGSWLSASSEIVNPYLGKKHPKYASGMLHCGELTDSVLNR